MSDLEPGQDAWARICIDTVPEHESPWIWVAGHNSESTVLKVAREDVSTEPPMSEEDRTIVEAADRYDDGKVVWGTAKGQNLRDAIRARRTKLTPSAEDIIADHLCVEVDAWGPVHIAKALRNTARKHNISMDELFKESEMSLPDSTEAVAQVLHRRQCDCRITHHSTDWFGMAEAAIATLEKLGYRRVEHIGYQDWSNGRLHTTYYVDIAERQRALEEDDLDVYETWRSGMEPLYREVKTDEI